MRIAGSCLSLPVWEFPGAQASLVPGCVWEKRHNVDVPEAILPALGIIFGSQKNMKIKIFSIDKGSQCGCYFFPFRWGICAKFIC